MRGPLLSGPLGSTPAIEALMRWLRPAAPVVVIGPIWLAETASAELPTLLLVEPEERRRAARAARRARTEGRPLAVALAGVRLPVARSSIGALVVEGASTLKGDAVARWMTALVPALRPGGRLLAFDATDDPGVETRLTSTFMSAALGDLVQERPRAGVLLTVGIAPAAAAVALRFAEDQASAPGP
jgi:hypothetical protein